jgi:hypothetical protein
MPNKDSNPESKGWNWAFGRTSTSSSSSKGEKGETTPLLEPAKSQHEPLAPPPSSAPPPPPDAVPKSDAQDDTSQSAISSKSISSTKSKRRKNAPDPTVESITAAHSHIKKTISKTIKKKFEGPRKSIFHILLDLVRLLAGLSSVMMLGMQVVPMFNMERGEDSEIVFGLQVAVR